MRCRHLDQIAITQAHPILRSIEPDEDWSWCTLDEVAFVLNRQ